MSTITDLTGFLASAMVLLTFMAKDMRHLRVLGIVSNMAFITYGVLAWLPPVFCLHLLLLPVNAFRLCKLLAEKGLQDADRVLLSRQEVFSAKSREQRRNREVYVRRIPDRRSPYRSQPLGIVNF